MQFFIFLGACEEVLGSPAFRKVRRPIQNAIQSPVKDYPIYLSKHPYLHK